MLKVSKSCNFYWEKCLLFPSYNQTQFTLMSIFRKYTGNRREKPENLSLALEKCREHILDVWEYQMSLLRDREYELDDYNTLTGGLEHHDFIRPHHFMTRALIYMFDLTKELINYQDQYDMKTADALLRQQLDEGLAWLKDSPISLKEMRELELENLQYYISAHAENTTKYKPTGLSINDHSLELTSYVEEVCGFFDNVYEMEYPQGKLIEALGDNNPCSFLDEGFIYEDEYLSVECQDKLRMLMNSCQGDTAISLNYYLNSPCRWMVEFDSFLSLLQEYNASAANEVQAQLAGFKLIGHILPKPLLQAVNSNGDDCLNGWDFCGARYEYCIQDEKLYIKQNSELMLAYSGLRGKDYGIAVEAYPALSPEKNPLGIENQVTSLSFQESQVKLRVRPRYSVTDLIEACLIKPEHGHEAMIETIRDYLNSHYEEYVRDIPLDKALIIEASYMHLALALACVYEGVDPFTEGIEIKALMSMAKEEVLEEKYGLEDKFQIKDKIPTIGWLNK